VGQNLSNSGGTLQIRQSAGRWRSRWIAANCGLSLPIWALRRGSVPNEIAPSRYTPRRAERRNDSRHCQDAAGDTGDGVQRGPKSRPKSPLRSATTGRGNHAGRGCTCSAGDVLSASAPAGRGGHGLRLARTSRSKRTRWCITIAAGPNRYEDRDRSASNRRTASTLRASGAEPGGDHSLARTNRTRGCSISRSVHNISTTTMQSLARPALNSTFRAHDR
jgi:hypothetical protein